MREQHFDNALIFQGGSGVGGHIEIVDSGIIEVREGEIDDEEGLEGISHNTDIEPYTGTFSNSDEIIVNSS
jgi:hypothetical protein